MEESKQNFYEHYTTTSVLSPGVDEEAFTGWSKRYFYAHFSKLLPADKNASVLEVACGYGKYLKALSEMGYTECFGIDISEEQILYAKNKLGLSNIEKADALDWLSDKNKEFDCILAIDILEHLDTGDLLDLTKKMFVALKPGGIIIIQVPNGISPLNPITYGDLTHIRAFTVRSMQQLFLYAGFVPIGYYEIPPYVHGVKTFFQRFFWSFMLKPIIAIFVRIAHGRVLGGDIFTSNFIAAAMRKEA